MNVDYVKINNDAEKLAGKITGIKSTKLRSIFTDIKKLQMSVRLKANTENNDDQAQISKEDLISKTLVLFRARLHYNVAKAPKKEKNSWDELKNELDRRIDKVLKQPELFEPELADFIEALVAYHKEKTSKEE